MEKALWTGKNIYKSSICCFHVSFRGCIIEVGYFIVFLTQLKLQKLCCHRKFGTETGEGESERERVVKEEAPSKLNGWKPEHELYFQNGVFSSIMCQPLKAI